MAIVTAGVQPASILVKTRKPAWLNRWARFAASTTFPDLPAEVIDRTRLVFLDSLGAIIAGSAEKEVKGASRRLSRLARARRGGSPLMDAFLGGTAGTMLEIDEGNQYARGHPGIHVVPAVMALSGQRGINGQDAILATALGYEIGARIGIASKLRVTMHPHGTWGTVGAALAAAKLHGASASRTAAAINVASSLGLTTSRRTMLEGGTVRNTYAGFSNMLGLMAWELTAAGFTGEADGIGSVYGTIAASDFQPALMTEALGERWEIARNYFKRHAACRYNHGALDALADIVKQLGRPLNPAEIVGVDVATYVWAAQLDHPAPGNMLAAKFSMPFSIATTIVNGAATLDAFRDPARTDEATRALALRVSINEDPALTAMLPSLRPARVTIRLTDGRSFTAQAMTNKGDTEDPYTSAEVQEKFLDVAAPVIGIEKARSLRDLALTMDQLGDISELSAAARTG